VAAKSSQSQSSSAGPAGALRQWLLWGVLVVVAIVGVLLSIGQGAAADRRPAAPNPAALTGFVPQNAVLTAALLVPPVRLPDPLTVLPSLQTTLRQRTGLDYDRDIRPWLGNEAVLAVLPPSPDAEPGYLLVLSVTDGDQAREGLELLWQRQALAGRPPILAEIDGAQAVLPAPGAALWPMALVGDRYLLVASTVPALYSSLRAVQAPALSLLRRRQYRAALSALSVPQLGLIHINLPAAIATAELATPPSSPQISDGLMSLAVESRVLRLQAALVGLLPQQPPPPHVASTSVTAELLPSTVTAMVLGHDLARLGQHVSRELMAYGQLPEPIATWSRWLATPFGQGAGPILQTWLTGPYALAHTRAGDSLLLAAHTPAAATAAAELDRLAQQHGLTVTSLTVMHHPVTAWTRLRTQTYSQPGTPQRETVVETEVVALHTVHQGQDLWATSIAALADTLNPSSSKLIAQSRFQQAVQRQDDYVYLDGTALLAELSGQLPWLDLLSLAAPSLLSRLDTVVVELDIVPGPTDALSLPHAQITVRLTPT